MGKPPSYVIRDRPVNLLEKKSILMQVFTRYTRWIREGKPKYRDEQYYYSGYHGQITPLENMPDHYKCAYQTYNGPDGDSWWYVTFKLLNGGTDVEIISEEFKDY